jgi:hypothetical protein
MRDNTLAERVAGRMAQPHETGHPTVTTDNPIADLLRAPLDSDWIVERLAEQLLGAIAARRSDEAQEFVFDADAATDHQSRRLLRPLLACLAAKSAAEAGLPVNLYGDQVAFQRPGSHGPVWVLGQFSNRTGNVRVALRRSATPPEASEAGPVRPTVPIDADGVSLSRPR